VTSEAALPLEEPTSSPTPRSRKRRRIPLTAIGGEDLSRIVSLSDGVFAFALTLLVLSLTVPSATLVTTNGKLGAALNHDLSTFIGYGFAFVMIAIWWVIHNRTYQYIAKFDSTLVWLNMMLLAQIAVMPFVLSVFSTFTSGEYEFRYAVILFAAIQVTLGLTVTLTWEYSRRAGLVKPNTPPSVSRYFTRRGYCTAGVFALSIGISFINVRWAEYSWGLIILVQRFLTIEGD
jgi:uncharacterized membrane protein